MSRAIFSERYAEDGLSITEYFVEIDNDEVAIYESLSGEIESEAVVVVQALEGEFESDLREVPLEPRDTPRQQDAYLVGTVAPRSIAHMRFVSKGFARFRVLIATIRRAFVRAGGRLPCRLCKLAISLILHAVLVSFGVPPNANGTFDLSNVINQLTQAFADITNGGFGQSLQLIQSILPSQWMAAILAVLKGLLWLFDATDAFYHEVCHGLGLCPPRSAIPSNP